MAWLACLLGMTGGLGAMTSSFSATMVARVMKYGMIATRSIMFIMSLLNSILLGRARNLTNNSNVNQIIHNVSTIKNGSVTSGTSSSSTLVPLAVVLNFVVFKLWQSLK